MTSIAIQSLFDLVRIRSRAALIVGVPICFGMSVLFLLYPELDIFVSRLFFDGQTTKDGVLVGFWLKDNQVIKFSITFVDIAARVILLGLLVLLIIRCIRRHSRVLTIAVVTFSLILGPAVVVNSVFKEHWDRARPRDIKTFGGVKEFSSPWVISDQCHRNCSFTSGHAAAGFSFIALHFIARSSLWLWLSLACGGLIGWTRIVVGAHFLSDIVFSFFLVYLISAAVAWILVTMAPNSARAIRI